jgi:hypothetical protein
MLAIGQATRSAGRREQTTEDAEGTELGPEAEASDPDPETLFLPASVSSVVNNLEITRISNVTSGA